MPNDMPLREFVGGMKSYTALYRRTRQDSEMQNMENTDIEFQYDDSDSHVNEMSELYSYTEEPEFTLNKKAFQELMEEYGIGGKWTTMNNAERRSFVMRLLDQVEVSQRHQRLRGMRAVLYLAQGVFGECDCEEEQQLWERQNVFLLYSCGVFSMFVELLNMEIENGGAANSALRKPAVSLADSTDLRVVLSVLYTICETMRRTQESDTQEMSRLRESFRHEISQPMANDDVMAVTLFGMVTKFCSGNTPHFPVRKVLLLLWKVLLVSLGGSEELKAMKTERREKADLAPAKEDTVDVARTMRAASPPASAADLLESQQMKHHRPFKRPLMKQNSMDDPMMMQYYLDDDRNDEELQEMDEQREMATQEPQGELPQPSSPRPSTPAPYKGLPWTPKVRQKDIDNFLNHTRMKFVGFPLQDDYTSLAGLPEPIHEGLKVLKQHVYISLSEIQIKKEEDIARNPISRPENEIIQTAAEVLYQAMLANLPQYMIALLKVLLAAAPTSKAKTDSINIMADVLPEEMPMTVPQSMKLGIDVNRHKEVIVKAVSTILLLLLKHFKLNHVYQFEFVSQHLVFANCIPLVLKFFNQNIMSYAQAKNSISVIDFPSCMIGEQPELTAETLCSPQDVGENQHFCWRNMFSCINLLRILNKLTKWKHSRIMMLVVFKSAPILKRALKVQHAMMQLYVLKLLKMQTKYLGRQWRKSNMKTMSAIYQKVRHRLNDDWAYGNDIDARPWDFQAEECTLRANVDRFNSRRYDRAVSACGTSSAGSGVGGMSSSGGAGSPSTIKEMTEFQPVDNCILSVLGQRMELTEEFKQNYELWLYQEVFQAAVDWEQLLCKNIL